jgi:hypothetical protein
MGTHRTRIGHSRTARLLAAAIGTVCLVVAVSTSAGAGAGTWKPGPSPKPTVPLDVTVAPGPGSGELVVSWSPPAYNGEFLNRHGQDIPYVITDYDLKGVPAKTWADCVDLSLTCTVAGLRPGHTYEVSVKVWNAKGRHSPFTVPVPGTATA